VVIAALVFPFARSARRRAHVRLWSRSVLDILAVRLDVVGEPAHAPGAPLMLVANHVSWLDVLAINAVAPARFVAKSEVRAWPVVGWLTEQAGTHFIRRHHRRDAARLSAALVRVMRQGDPVAVFPEATTTDGGTVLHFYSSLLQPAVAAGAAVQPVAVRYTRADGTPCTEAAFTGGLSLWGSLRLMAAQPGIRAQLAFLPPLASTGRHRRELARGARDLILQTLFPRAPSNPAGPAFDPPGAARSTRVPRRSRCRGRSRPR
jgi:1-acyl-sn-glycerol-3-phosphate acyltransferase